MRRIGFVFWFVNAILLISAADARAQTSMAEPSQELSWLKILCVLLVLCIVILYALLWMKDSYIARLLTLKEDLEHEKYFFDF